MKLSKFHDRTYIYFIRSVLHYSSLIFFEVVVVKIKIFINYYANYDFDLTHKIFIFSFDLILSLKN